MTKKIDWKKVAKDHGLTTEEFQNELLLTTAATCAVIIEQGNAQNGTNNNLMSVTFDDKNGNPDMRITIENLKIQ